MRSFARIGVLRANALGDFLFAWPGHRRPTTTNHMLVKVLPRANAQREPTLAQ